MIYLLTAIVLIPGGSSTVHICTQKYTEQHNKSEFPERNIQIQISLIYKYVLIKNKSKAKICNKTL